MTWAELIAAVRAQIDVSDDQAYAWLLDRARVMNGDAHWLVREATWAATGELQYALPDDHLTTEAIVVGGRPYRRSTPSALDIARSSGASKPIYAEGVDTAVPNRYVQIWPPVSAGVEVYMRYVTEVPDNRTGSPPFPVDVHGGIADGAIALGLARMDERFDSAGYFDARFADQVQRLRRRRNSHVGRGGTPIRLVS